MQRKQFKYQSYFCEENIWQLCAQLFAENPQKLDISEVWIISNPKMQVCFHQQKAAKNAKYLVWDYHVIFYKENHIIDFDSQLGFSNKASKYLQQTFPMHFQETLAIAYQPLFLRIPANWYLKNFQSDRTHMIRNGIPVCQHPSWPLILKNSDFNFLKWLQYIFNQQTLFQFRLLNLKNIRHSLDSKTQKNINNP